MKCTECSVSFAVVVELLLMLMEENCFSPKTSATIVQMDFLFIVQPITIKEFLQHMLFAMDVR